MSPQVLLSMLLFVVWATNKNVSVLAAIRPEVSIIHAFTTTDNDDGMATVSYRVVNEHNQTVFHGGDIAVYMQGIWCVAPSGGTNFLSVPSSSSSSSGVDRIPSRPLRLMSHDHDIRGHVPGIGTYTGTRLEWSCDSQPVVTSFLSFATSSDADSTSTILFQLEWPQGAENTTVLDDVKDQTASLSNFPAFVMTKTCEGGDTVDLGGECAFISPLLPNTLSWEGSFVQSVRGLSTGPRGGPTLFYNASSSFSSSLDSVVVIGSSLGSSIIIRQNTTRRRRSGSNNRIYWNTYTAGNHLDWSRTRPSFSPGVSGRIAQLPPHFQHSYILYESSGGGITATMNDWGSMLQRYANNPLGNATRKVDDVTLNKIGIQTDNGAYYCFCKEANCSEVLLQNKRYLDDIGIPVGYLSYQGAGTSRGRGQAAPWCVQQWSADGGQDRNHYPLDTKDLQEALGVPLQLYAPYYCPNSTYFGRGFPWRSVISNPILPGCNSFAFENVHPEDSKKFFTWFMKKGVDAGMKSFETDFMNQNVNCVEEFIRSPSATDDFLYGMAEAAADLDIPIQWCYASPNEVFSSLSMPAVTNFRVSFDFCYGRSYGIGESSLLVWALGAAPSKDTLWSTDNNHTETPGCSWTQDHENVAIELHIVLALMSTGPFGLSDGIGMTNATLIYRAISKDGTLLQPIKPITAVDSTFLKSGPKGSVYGTFGVGPSWIFVSFQLQEDYSVKLKDLYPSIDPSPKAPRVMAVRKYSDNICIHGEDAVESGCVHLLTLIKDDGNDNPTIFKAPKGDVSSPGSYLSPTVTAVWHACVDSGVVFLGELDKYIPVSPKRFDSVVCTDDGVSTVAHGSSGEAIEITYLIPQPNELLRENRYKVMTKTVDFASSPSVPIDIRISFQTVNRKS